MNLNTIKNYSETLKKMTDEETDHLRKLSPCFAGNMSSEEKNDNTYFREALSELIFEDADFRNDLISKIRMVKNHASSAISRPTSSTKITSADCVAFIIDTIKKDGADNYLLLNREYFENIYSGRNLDNDLTNPKLWKRMAKFRPESESDLSSYEDIGLRSENIQWVRRFMLKPYEDEEIVFEVYEMNDGSLKLNPVESDQ